MRSFEEQVALVGQRLLLWTPRKERQIGLGTYLWDDEILLDSGKKIREQHCIGMSAPPSPVPKFEVTLQNDTRVFEGVCGLKNTGIRLHPGERLLITKIRCAPWNHGTYVAGDFFYRGEPYSVLMSELVLPFEVPNLQPAG
jgi:hypothetical protein